ncbi:MAG: sugar phosphate nucleotidyltransferase [Candidatus Nanopelagicales bacterium]
MRAVVMAGGEGTRLRPLTTGTPKPLLPVVGRPLMEHVLRLLRRHGIDDTVVTVQYLASLVRSYFGDGSDLGITLTYATEHRPLGTAGSVRNAAAALRDDTFLVMSGDALTDVDLTALTDFHRERGALVTVCLARRPDPVEFGIVISDEEGRVDRFLEKPTWGQVFSDTVNTGIYVMEPELLDHVPEDTVVDWSRDVLPRLVSSGAPVYGFVADGYWEDVGTLASYLRAQADVLDRRVDADIDGFEVAPGVWIAEGAEVDPDVEIVSPVYLGPYAKVEGGAELGAHSVLGTNVVVRSGARIERSVLHDNVFIGPGADLRGCVVGRSTDVMRAARIEEGAVIADECTLEEEVIVMPDVLVFPAKTLEAGAVVRDSVIWESRGHRHIFGPRGVSGIVNVEITPELVVRLGAAFATTLPKGARITVGRDHSRAARAFNRALAGSLTAAGLDVRDLRTMPAPLIRQDVARHSAGGVILRTTTGSPESIDLVLLDDTGSNLSPGAQQKLERVFSRKEFRRPFPGDMGDIGTPHRVVDDYAHEILRVIDTSGVEEAGLKVVVDAGGGTASMVLPTLLARIGVNILTVNNRLDESAPTETDDDRDRALEGLGALVASSSADFGVRFDTTGERLSLVDETGAPIDDGRALLVVLDLVAAERHGGIAALPVTTTRAAEQVAGYHGVGIRWTRRSVDELTAVAAEPGVIFAGDGRGGFVVPEMGPHIDGMASFVRLLGLVARTQLTLSAIDRRIPRTTMLRARVPTPWARKGQVMRAAIDGANGRQVDTTDGVRIVEPDGRWVLVLPDPTDAATRLWAEGPDEESTRAILDDWVSVVEGAAG